MTACVAHERIDPVSRSVRPAVLLWLCRPALARPRAAPVELRILAINDFHGNLRPPAGGIAIADPADKTKKIAVPAGGAEHMATLVQQLRQAQRTPSSSPPAT